MRQLRITRRRATRPTADDPAARAMDLLVSCPVTDAAVTATLAHIDEVLCESR